MKSTYSNNDPIHRLQAKQSFGSKAVQKLARFALAKREEIASLAIAEFARSAGVSQTTVVRLCKELGYAGYRDFRMAIVESRGHRRGADLLGVDMPVDAASSTKLSTIAKQVIRINADILRDTYELLDIDNLERAINLILSASHVYVVGFGSSAAVALDVCQRLLRLGISSSVYSDPHIVATVSANGRPGALFFGISYTGTTRDLIECLQTAKTRNLRSIAITSFAASAVAKAADVALISALRSPDFPAETISSRVSQLAIVDVLFVGLALRHPWKPELVEALEHELRKKRMQTPPA